MQAMKHKSTKFQSSEKKTYHLVYPCPYMDHVKEDGKTLTKSRQPPSAHSAAVVRTHRPIPPEQGRRAMTSRGVPAHEDNGSYVSRTRMTGPARRVHHEQADRPGMRSLTQTRESHRDSGSCVSRLTCPARRMYHEQADRPGMRSLTHTRESHQDNASCMSRATRSNRRVYHEQQADRPGMRSLTQTRQLLSKLRKESLVHGRNLYGSPRGLRTGRPAGDAESDAHAVEPTQEDIGSHHDNASCVSRVTCPQPRRACADQQSDRTGVRCLTHADRCGSSAYSMHQNGGDGNTRRKKMPVELAQSSQQQVPPISSHLKYGLFPKSREKKSTCPPMELKTAPPVARSEKTDAHRGPTSPMRPLITMRPVSVFTTKHRKGRAQYVSRSVYTTSPPSRKMKNLSRSEVLHLDIRPTSMSPRRSAWGMPLSLSEAISVESNYADVYPEFPGGYSRNARANSPQCRRRFLSNRRFSAGQVDTVSN